MTLHTSKRMHFIEDRQQRALLRGFYGPCIRQNVCTSLRSVPTVHAAVAVRRLHTSKRMHFIEECCRIHVSFSCGSCIRQNVCTSLRSYRNCQGDTWATHLHTSKRMHFIEDTVTSTKSQGMSACIRQNVCTSLRIIDHVVKSKDNRLAYVKTYALH